MSTCVHIGPIAGSAGAGSELPSSVDYASLPVATGGDTLRRVSGPVVGNPPFQGADVYRDVADLDGTDPLLMWLPESIARLSNLDYVRNLSGDPCKISTANGVGSDDLSALTSRGWTVDLGDGNGVIQDASGDIEIDSTACLTSAEVRLRFDSVDPATWGTGGDAEGLIYIVEWDMITINGSASEARGFRSELNHGSPGGSGLRYRTFLSGARAATANRVGWASNGSTGIAGNGLNHSAFERFLAVASRGAGGTDPPREWTHGPYLMARGPWYRSSADFRTEAQTGVVNQAGTANAGVDYVHLMTGPPDNGGLTVARIREFHLLRYDANQ